MRAVQKRLLEIVLQRALARQINALGFGQSRRGVDGGGGGGGCCLLAGGRSVLSR